MAVVTAGTLPVFLLGGLSVQVRADLDLGESALGIGIAAFFAGGALTSTVFGRLAERLGPAPSMRLSAAASATCLLAIALLGRSLTAIALLLAVGGLANSLAQPAANLFVARTVPSNRLGLAFALKQSAIPAGTLLAGAAVPTLALTLGWRTAFAAGVVIALLAIALVPKGAGGAEASGPVAAGGRQGPGPQLGGRAPLVVLALAIGLGSSAVATLGTFLVNAAVHAGMGEGRAGLLVSAGGAMTIASRLRAGRAADRREGGNLRVVARMLVLGTAAYLCFATGRISLIVLATPLAFAGGWGWPGLFNLAVARAYPDAPGAASGVTQTGTYIGAVVGPLLFGSVAENVGYAAAWMVAASCSLAAAGLMTAGRALLQRGRREDAGPLPPPPAENPSPI
jgi:predicted MFS family arabinose efflux permease